MTNLLRFSPIALADVRVQQHSAATWWLIRQVRTQIKLLQTLLGWLEAGR